MTPTSTTSTVRTFLRAAAVSATIALPLVLTGCYNEGGPGYSADQYTYISTSWRPWTITLKDTRTGQAFWSVDVPVGKELVVKFVPDEGTKDNFTPDLMKWAIMDAGEEYGRLGNSLPVPGKNDRRLDGALRPSPELPPGMTPTKRPPVSIKTTGGKTKSDADDQ